LVAVLDGGIGRQGRVGNTLSSDGVSVAAFAAIQKKREKKQSQVSESRFQ